MSTVRRLPLAVLVLAAVLGASGLPGCKRNDPPANPLKTQQEAMERAKGVGGTMQKGVDREGKKADEEGR